MNEELFTKFAALAFDEAPIDPVMQKLPDLADVRDQLTANNR